MGVWAVVLILLLLATLAFFIYYPYPAIWLSKRLFNKGVYESLNTGASVLTTLHFENEKNRVFNGNIYEFLYNGATPTGKDMIIWFHGGGFIDGVVRGKPKVFDMLLSRGIRIFQFDYPTIFKFSQSDAFSYVASVVKWMFESGPASATDTRVWIAGDSAGALMSTLLINNILNDDRSWGDLSSIKGKLSNPTIVWNISGFYPNVSNNYIRWIWNTYIQRGSKIKYDKVPIIHSAMRVVNFSGSKDVLLQDARDLVKANASTCMAYEYEGKDHEFPFASIDDANSVDVFGIIGDYILGVRYPVDPTIGENVLPQLTPAPEPTPEPTPDPTPAPSPTPDPTPDPDQ